MLEFFSSISNIIVTLLQLLINSVSGIVNIITLSIEYIAYLMQVLAYIPAPLLAFAAMGISLSVILLLVGRNT